MEQDMLAGAEECIARYSPRFALSHYHSHNAQEYFRTFFSKFPGYRIQTNWSRTFAWKDGG
jgi:hypothetical protein